MPVPASCSTPAAAAGSMAVFFREGDEVHKGDLLLLRLDAERLDNEIIRRRRTIQADQDELSRLATP